MNRDLTNICCDMDKKAKCSNDAELECCKRYGNGIKYQLTQLRFDITNKSL